LEKSDVRNLEKGFILRITDYGALKLAVLKDMEEVMKLLPAKLVEPAGKEAFLTTEFQRTHGLNNAATLPSFSTLLVQALVPQKIRHLLFFQEWHFLGKRKFSQEIFSMFKCTCFTIFFSRVYCTSSHFIAGRIIINLVCFLSTVLTRGLVYMYLFLNNKLGFPDKQLEKDASKRVGVAAGLAVSRLILNSANPLCYKMYPDKVAEELKDKTKKPLTKRVLRSIVSNAMR
jgi:hypothetical protein